MKKQHSASKSAAGKKVQSPAKDTQSVEASTLSGEVYSSGPIGPARGMDSESAGQSGDVQGLSGTEDVDSESVQELLEEGQSHEAEIVSGVEDALDPDQGEVRTHSRRSSSVNRK